MSRSLKTGDLVLCKVGSFPPWPAVVYPQTLLRSDVYRKKKPNCVAVCFFNDPTYYWEQPHRLQRLQNEDIERYLDSNGSGSGQSDLLEAYQQASNFKSLHDFIVDRFQEEGRDDDLEETIVNGNIKSGEDPFIDKIRSNGNVKRKMRLKKTASNSPLTDSNEITDNYTSGPKSKRVKYDYSSNELRQNTPNTGEKLDKRTRNESKDSTHKLQEKDKERRTKLDWKRRVEISLLFRRRIQKNLVQRDDPPTEEEIEESHNMLKKISQNLDNEPPFFDLDALRESKLHKLFKVIVNDSNLEQFHPMCKNALMQWEDTIIELKAEKLKNEK